MNTALLIIDVQKSLIDEGIWDSDRVITQLNQLLDKARSEDSTVIFIRDTRVEPDGELHQFLDCGSNDTVIVKSFCDSFMETNLEEVLKNKNISKLVVGGMQSDYCVDATCRQEFVK